MKNDNRHYFEQFTTCKAGSWKEVEELHPTPAQTAALNEMPVLMAKRAPCVSDEALMAGHEFIVIFNKEFYYVNTEGYDYARYAVRLVNFVPEVKL